MRTSWLPLLLAGVFGLAVVARAASDAETYGSDFFYTFSAKPAELAADSSLRRELFDSIRSHIPASNKFDGPLQVFRNWAFFSGKSVDAAGKTYFYPGTEFSTVAAIWLRARDGEKFTWKLIDSSFGAASDTPYRDWPYRYGAPSELFGMNATPRP
jgi:hypothetical protein